MKKHLKAYGLVPYIIEDDDIKILLCKSVSSKDKWGCLKGMQESKETAYECAQREFEEESSIEIQTSSFEKYFEQTNKNKDVGIWLVEHNKIENFEKYFHSNILYDNFLSWENSKVKFHSIFDLPPIKKKQEKLIKEIKKYLQNQYKR